ncbi:hypothetical protein ACVWW4_007847 [Bradyrhizobium sp. LB7.1]
MTQFRVPAFLDALDDVAGQRTDIGAPVAADLGLVMHAAEADAHEGAIHRACDGLAERGLADAGRPDEAQDRRLALRRELAHRQIFDDPGLDLLQAKVISVEDAARFLDVDRLLRGQRPGQLDQPVQIGTDHAGFAGGLRHALVAPQLLLRMSIRLGRHVGLGDGSGQLGDLGRLAVAFAELALDGRHLLAQDRLALPFVEAGAGLLADLVADA